MTPITDDDLRRWQLRKVERLAQLVKDAAIVRLPPLTWTVHTAGPLLGVANNGETFEQWAAFLNAERGDGWSNETTRYLTAYVTSESHDFREIAISARIPLDG